jgi:hypothetical protein
MAAIMTITIICIVVFWGLLTWLAWPGKAPPNHHEVVAWYYAKTHNLPEPPFDYTFGGKYELQEDGIHYAPTRKRLP